MDGRLSGQAYGRHHPVEALLVLGSLVVRLFLMAREPGHGRHAAPGAAMVVAALPLTMHVTPPDGPAMPALAHDSVAGGAPLSRERVTFRPDRAAVMPPYELPDRQPKSSIRPCRLAAPDRFRKQPTGTGKAPRRSRFC